MTTFTRILPDSIRTPLIRRTILAAAGLALTGGTIAGPAIAAHAAEPTHSGKPHTAIVTTDHGNNGDNGGSNGGDNSNHGGNGNHGGDNGNRGGDNSNHSGNNGDNGNRGSGGDNRGGEHRNRAKDVTIDYQAQPNFYYCGPASTRIALTATGHNLTQDEIAQALGTTEAGTPSAEDTTRVLNQIMGSNKYQTTAIPTTTITPEQINQLKTDIVTTIDDNRAIVANIAGTATDTDGNIHSYEGGHYITVVGYQNDGDIAKIADPANPNTASYWVNTTDLANWMATHGYSH
jgi:hypothetical protein